MSTHKTTHLQTNRNCLYGLSLFSGKRIFQFHFHLIRRVDQTVFPLLEGNSSPNCCNFLMDPALYLWSMSLRSKTAIKFSMSIFFKINHSKFNRNIRKCNFFILKNYLIRLIYCLLSTSIQNMNKMIYAGLIFCI